MLNHTSSVSPGALCLEETFMIWIPCAFVFIFAPLQFYFARRRKPNHLLPRPLLIGKFVIAACLVALGFANLLHNLIRAEERTSVLNIVNPLLLTLSWALLLYLMNLNRQHGIVSAGMVYLSWLLFVILGLPEVRSKVYIIHEKLPYPDAHMIFFFCYYALLVVELILQSWADTEGHPDELDKRHKESDKPDCPEFHSSFLNQITFNWFTKLAWLGWKRPLTHDDLWSLNDRDSSQHQVPRWERNWLPAVEAWWKRREAFLKTAPAKEKIKVTAAKVAEEEVTILDGKKKKKEKEEKEIGPAKPSLIWHLFLVTKHLLIPGVVFKFTADLIQFINPQLLKKLIQFVQKPKAERELAEGLAYTGLLFGVSIFYSILLHQFFHRAFTVGMNVRTVLTSAVFRKSLRLSNSARKKGTIGEIVNLMSVDVTRFQEVANYVNLLWSCPMQLLFAIYMLWLELGPSVLAGIGLMILLAPVNGFLATILRKLNAEQMKLKDERIKVLTEVLQGMKVLKLYAWEPSYEKQVLAVRAKELKLLRKMNVLHAITSIIWNVLPFLVTAVTFATYVLSDKSHILTAEKAFVSLALFNILRFPLSVFPMMIAYFVQASVSNKRLKDFLCADELADSEMIAGPESSDKKSRSTPSPGNRSNKGGVAGDDKSPSVSVTEGSFSWDKDQHAGPTLRDINLEVPRGSLVAVVGQVGTGKSSLLSAMLGEMETNSGTVHVDGSVAYVPQQAWIQNRSLRSNITFSKPYDSARYNKTVDACALRQDFDILPGGDETEIGEKGINLSGGQKQRVSLARAVYSDADIYLLDDPLSAVDSHVAKHIFDEVIGSEGMLKEKSRIFVTHRLNYLKDCDLIVVLTDGRISETGTYSELIASKGAFADFLAAYVTEMAEDDEESAEGLLSDLQETDPELCKRLEKQISEVNPASPTLRQMSSVSSRRRSSSEKDRHPKSSENGALPPDPKKPKTNIIEGETVETGSVHWSIYVTYARAIGIAACFVITLMYAASQGCAVGSNIWLSDWSDANEKIGNGTDDDLGRRLGVYVSLGLGQGVFTFFGAIVMSFATVIASNVLHSRLLHNLMRSPMSFFDVTPTGRIVNRCGKDIDTLDMSLPMVMRMALSCYMQVLGVVLVICVSTPIFSVVIIPLAIAYYFVQRFYVSTSRQLKRLESVSRSPIYSHFQETVQGASSIRAYRSQQRFINESEEKVDFNVCTYYPNIVSNRWLAVRLELVASLIVFFAAIFAVSSGNVTGGLAGLSISYAMSVTQTLNWAVRMTSDVEANIVAVERIREYTETPQEAEWKIPKSEPPSEWPQSGQIEFEKYATRYRPGLELVLKEVSLKIEPKEKVGIVGRTGAGKSSLTLAVFRLIEPAEGKILIDGVDISVIGLHDLRGKLTIIPQDPVLFSGTLRLNLDPFEQYDDAELWSALEQSYLKDFVSSLPDKLEHTITESGENISVGQRQLVCLARALLRKSRVLVLDEATAAIDMETDELIQKTIRDRFTDCTVLTIAHRLNTIMDSTRVLVLSKGKVAEYDSPTRLLADKNSLFYGMAKDAGLA